MRSIVNISLPPQRKIEIEQRAKKAKKSISAYILYAIQLEQSLISEDELLKMAKDAENDYRNGETKELKSLADLMN